MQVRSLSPASITKIPGAIGPKPVKHNNATTHEPRHNTTDRHAHTYAPAARHWSRLDRAVCFLNHGSFGACPDPVLDYQSTLRDQLEREPLRFMLETLEPALEDATEKAAAFVNADPRGFAFVRNTTEAVNAVARSLDLAPGDELLTTNHAYNACANALRFAAERAHASVITAHIPVPVPSEDDIVNAITACATPCTRLALIDHITSPTGVVLPIERIVRELEAKGVPTLVDGAHAPGMVNLDIASINPAWYAGNWHKWVCAPKGAGFLWAREDHRDTTRPAVISHGANSTRTDISRFRAEFDWTGTADPTAYLCVPTAIDTLAQMLPGGWPEIRKRNRDLALAARRTLAEELALQPIASEAMTGSLAALVLPDTPNTPDPDPAGDDAADRPAGIGVAYATELQRRLVHEEGVQVPVIPWDPAEPGGAGGAHGGRLVRVSAHLYNDPAGHDVLARALRTLMHAC